jgi:hypothetical protein
VDFIEQNSVIFPDIGALGTQKRSVPMSFKAENQGTINTIRVDDYLLTWMEAFLIDCKASGVTSGTMHFYQIKLKLFSGYCEAQTIKYVSQITPTFLRQFLLYIEETGHNPGWRHAAYHTIRTFLYWYEEEVMPKDWTNPISIVKFSIIPVKQIEPDSIEMPCPCSLYQMLSLSHRQQTIKRGRKRNRLYCLRGWWFVPQGAMWFDLIVLFSPLFNRYSCLLQSVKDLTVKQFIPELSIEAFAIAILPGTSWFDE